MVMSMKFLMFHQIQDLTLEKLTLFKVSLYYGYQLFKRKPICIKNIDIIITSYNSYNL